jgi:hypothetical protein
VVGFGCSEAAIDRAACVEIGLRTAATALEFSFARALSKHEANGYAVRDYITMEMRTSTVRIAENPTPVATTAAAAVADDGSGK